MREEKLEYIRNWIFRASEDYAVIKSLEKSGIEFYTSSICFHAQQAVEKYLKAFLIYNDIDFPRTHDVDYLLLECNKIDDEYDGDGRLIGMITGHDFMIRRWGGGMWRIP